MRTTSQINTTIQPNSPEIQGISGPDVPKLSSIGDKKPGTIQSNRCGICSKKTGLTGFTCRCGANYCGIHRYPDEHSCSFDFKKNERANLEKSLMVGKLVEKIHKI